MSERWKKIIKVSSLLLILIGISIGFFFLFRALGITDAYTLKEIIKGLGFWAVIVFFLLQIVVNIGLCFIPMSSMAFIICGCLVFGPWKAAIICCLAVFTASMIMFAIGDKLGEKIAIKLVGEKDLRKAQDLLQERSLAYIPIMFMFPLFPDDAICLAAGMTDMKYKHFMPIALFFRSIGVVASCILFVFVGPEGSLLNLLHIEDFRTIDWIILVNILIIDIYLFMKFLGFLERKISKISKQRRERVKIKQDLIDEDEKSLDDNNQKQ